MHKIYINDGCLSFYGSQLASVEQYSEADRCVGSVFEALEPGETVELKEGFFILDEELDLISNDRPCNCGSGLAWAECPGYPVDWSPSGHTSAYCG